MKRRNSTVAVALMAACCLVSDSNLHAQNASADAEVSAVADASKSRTLADAKLGETRNVHAFGETLLCGQPTANEFGTARDRGIQTVITLREPNEIDWNEPQVVKSLGMDFYAFGFRTPESLTFELLDRVLAVMADEDRQPVMLHCASANRVGAVWMAHRVLHDELDFSKAKVEAKQVGLRTPAYEAVVLEYIRNRQSKIDD